MEKDGPPSLFVFLKFKEDKNFFNIFQHVEQMARVTKHLRISVGSVVLAMSELMNAVKLCGGSGIPLSGPGTHGSTAGTQEG